MIKKMGISLLTVLGGVTLWSANSTIKAHAAVGYVQKNVKMYREPTVKNYSYQITQYNVPLTLAKSTHKGWTRVKYDNHYYYIRSNQITNQPQFYNKSYGVDHYTRYDLQNMIKHQHDRRFKLPKFDASQIKDFDAAREATDEATKGDKLDISDHWVLKNPNGKIANYHGYHIMFSMTFNRITDEHEMNGRIYLFYQKVSQGHDGMDSWHSAGPVFLNSLEGAKNPTKLQREEIGQWSGSAVTQANGKLRLFYTSYSGKEQSLATSAISVTANQNGVSINHNRASDHKLIFRGDGKYYETLQQMNSEKGRLSNDDHTLRDAYFVEEKGHKYLVFEGNTGPKSGKEGYHSLSNLANLGGNKQFATKENLRLNRLNSRDAIKDVSAYANAAIGIVELNNNYTIKKVMKPLIVFNGVEDETERPTIVRHDGRFYLFTSMHGWHMAGGKAIPQYDAYVLGFSAKSLTGHYSPLNQNGLVLHSDSPYEVRTMTYSYDVLPSDKSPFIVTSNMSEIGNEKLGYSTLAPSMLLQVKGNQTNLVKNKILKQGQIIK